MRFTLSASLALILTVAAVLDECGAVRARSVTGHLHERHRAHLPGQLSGMPSARQHRADVAADVRGGAALGEIDQAEGRRAGDAAMVHRQERRRPALQQRSFAQPDADIETIVKWVDAGAPEGNPADMPPPRKFPDGDAWQIGKPDVIVTLPKDVHGSGEGARQVAGHSRGSRPDGGSVHQGCADHPDQGIHRSSTTSEPPSSSRPT